jgi:hypothetical protein
MEKTTKRGALWPALLTKYYLGDKIKKDGMGWACGKYGGVKRFWLGNLRERDNF